LAVTIVNQDNVIVAVDMGAANAREVKRMIDRSFTEQKIRFQTEHKDGEQMDASRRYQELKELRDAVANQGDTLRYVTYGSNNDCHSCFCSWSITVQWYSAVSTAP